MLSAPWLGDVVFRAAPEFRPTVFSGENYRELIARCAAGTKSAPPTRRGQEEDPGRPGKAKVDLERTVGTTSKVAVFRRSNFECVRSMKLILGFF